MPLPKDFNDRPITDDNLKLLKKHRDNDDELCTDAQVWIDLFNGDAELPAIMDSVIAWIAPPPQG